MFSKSSAITLAGIASSALGAAPAFAQAATGPDMTALTSAISVGTVVTAVLSVGAIIIGVTLAQMGVRKVISLVKGG